MSVKHVHHKSFRSSNFLARLHCCQLTGIRPNCLSFLPDDRQRENMEIETVALLPVLRRLEVQVGGRGPSQSLSGLRLLLEHLSLRAHGQPSQMFGGVHQVQEEMDTSRQPLCEKIGAKFIEEGGIPLVLALLMAGCGNLETNPRSLSHSADLSLVKQKQLALDVLCQLCLVSKTAEILGETDELLIFCFHHMCVK